MKKTFWVKKYKSTTAIKKFILRNSYRPITKDFTLLYEFQTSTVLPNGKVQMIEKYTKRTETDSDLWIKI